MIDHMYLPVSDLERSRAFYRDLLRPLGIEESFTLRDSVGFGVGKPGAFWLYPAAGRTGGADDPCGLDTESSGLLPRLHVALRAETRQQVQDASTIGEQLGAQIVHPPRVFTEYHDAYFATFLRDPDGHNIEVVCPTPV